MSCPDCAVAAAVADDRSRELALALQEVARLEQAHRSLALSAGRAPRLTVDNERLRKRVVMLELALGAAELELAEHDRDHARA